MGLDQEAEYENLEIPLESGDTILFYTDGLTEILGRAEDPEEGYQTLCSLGKGRGALGLLEKLTADMETMEGVQELEDDVSYVLLSMK